MPVNPQISIRIRFKKVVLCSPPQFVIASNLSLILFFFSFSVVSPTNVEFQSPHENNGKSVFFCCILKAANSVGMKGQFSKRAFGTSRAQRLFWHHNTFIINTF